MSGNARAKLFCGTELDFCTTDEMDEDYERDYSDVGVYARHIARSMDEGPLADNFNEETLAEQYGLRVLMADNSLFLAIEDSVTEVSGNGIHDVNSLAYSRRYEELLGFALLRIDNSETQPKWLLATDCN